MASFLLIIIILSSFYLITQRVFIKKMEQELVNGTNERFLNVANKFDLSLEQINKKNLLNIYIELSKKLDSNYLSAVDYLEIQKYLTNNRANSQHIHDFLIFKDTEDYIITTNGTYRKDRFFDYFFKSTQYNQQFWEEELEKNFTYKVYPTQQIITKNIDNSNQHKNLLPMVLKPKRKSKMIIIALVDIDSLTYSIEENFLENFAIFDDEENILYASTIEEIDISTRNTMMASPQRYGDRGYLFLKESSKNSLIYAQVLPNGYFKEALHAMNRTFQAILLISIVISGIISIVIVIQFNNPVKQLAEEIKKSNHNKGLDVEDNDLHFMYQNIFKIIKENSNYVKDIYEKESLLENFFYEAKIKNIYLQMNHVKNSFLDNSKYAMIYFKVHYKKTFYEYISEEESKGTFFLRHLIEVYIGDYFKDSYTFQIEDNQIISLVSVGNEIQSIFSQIQEIKDKLKLEEEHLFFTIAISNIYDEPTYLNEVYKKIFEVAKNRKAIAESQVLSEEVLNSALNMFYLPKQYQEELANSITSGQQEQCIRRIDNILEYNYKKEVNSFYLYLLCGEILSICSKALFEVYNQVPEEININNKYSQLKKCVTLEDYKKICTDFTIEFIEYVNLHIPKEDYIIDFVKGYIEDHYDTDIYLDLLSDKLNITGTYLSSYFKSKTGINFNDYLNDYRIKQAAEVLRDTSLKIKEVGEKVGIPNQNTFIRLFKKYKGETPSEYRKNII